MNIVFRHVPFSQAQVNALNELAAKAGYRTIWCDGNALPDEAELKDTEILMGYFPPDLLRGAPALKWLQTPCAGVERWCADELYPSPDVVLTNCSGAFGVAISEYMLTGLLMLMRNMPAYLDNQKARVWKGAGLCRSIYGSTIVVVGMGDIGTKFAARAKALGARVRGVRRVPDGVPEHFDEVYASDRLIDAVRDADAVVMCLPGTPATTGMLSEEVIAAMPNKAIVVNCGRGRTVDQAALTRALAEKRIAGAVLDVFASEPLPEDDPLWSMENVIVTPHISGHDDDPVNAQAIFEIFVDNLTRYAQGQPLVHVVNRSRGY